MGALIKKPEALESHHILEEFACGEPSLDNWLKKNARKNQMVASQTFVAAVDGRVVGYYCLAAGSILHSDASGALKRNMPNPIPVIILGRLTVDNAYQGQNIARGLLQDALLRANTIQQNMGARAVIVHALNKTAQGFYKKFGFGEFSHNALILFLPIPWKR